MKAFVLVTLLTLLLEAPVNSQSSTPLTSTSVPATASSAPASSTSVPATSSSDPSTSASVPATSSSDPSTSTSVPATSSSDPSTSTSVPATSSSAPATSSSAPATSSSAPASSPSVPDTSASVPDTSPSTPSPAASVPATSASGPAPAPSNSAPGTSLSPTSTKNDANTTTSKVLPLTPTPSPIGPIDPCQNSSCGQDSSCVALNSSYFCLCSEGYYYHNNSGCQEGKIFPGSITVQVLQSEISDLEDKNSKAYEGLHEKVNEFFKDAFNYSSNDSEYGQTVIIKVSISPSARSGMYADSIVNVSVVNILIENTKYNQSSVAAIIQKAVGNGSSGINGYTMKDRCDYYGCKKDGANDCNNGLQCECKDGYQRPYPQVAVCVASSPVCPDTCNEKNKKQCLLKEDGSTSECVCLPGYRDNKGECETCPFGYSGLNCQDQFQLILTIVGTIAGILIIGMVIAFIVSSRLKNKKKDAEEQNLIENDFQNLKLQQTGFTNFGASGSIFPKVQTTASKDRQLQNPYINSGSMPRPDY